MVRPGSVWGPHETRPEPRSADHDDTCQSNRGQQVPVQHLKPEHEREEADSLCHLHADQGGLLQK